MTPVPPTAPSGRSALTAARAEVVELRRAAGELRPGVVVDPDRPTPWGRLADGARATVESELQAAQDADGPLGARDAARVAVGHLNAVRSGLAAVRFPAEGELDAATAKQAQAVVGGHLDLALGALDEAVARADGSWAYDRWTPGHEALRTQRRTLDDDAPARAARPARPSNRARGHEPTAPWTAAEATTLAADLRTPLPSDRAAAAGHLRGLAHRLEQLATAQPPTGLDVAAGGTFLATQTGLRRNATNVRQLAAAIEQGATPRTTTFRLPGGLHGDRLPIDAFLVRLAEQVDATAGQLEPPQAAPSPSPPPPRDGGATQQGALALAKYLRDPLPLAPGAVAAHLRGLQRAIEVFATSLPAGGGPRFDAAREVLGTSPPRSVAGLDAWRTQLANQLNALSHVLPPDGGS